MEHEQGIAKGRSRIEEIERQKKMNVARVELQNDELQHEAGLIAANEEALNGAIEEIDNKLKLMVKESGDG
jgi:hypothetical protein